MNEGDLMLLKLNLADDLSTPPSGSKLTLKCSKLICGHEAPLALINILFIFILLYLDS
jgi:hypothetical protein